MSFHTRLCTFKTDDNERLHGLLFTPQDQQTDLALLFVHGVAKFLLAATLGFRAGARRAWVS